MLDYPVTAFKHGIINAIEAQSIPDGAASDSLNWLTKGDKIELSRGSRVVGDEIAGVGRVSGIHTAYRADGTEVYFGTRGMSVLYSLDSADGPWTEIGTNILGAEADGEDVLFSNYATNAGAQCWFSSPNSGLFKIMTANPGDYTNMYDGSKNFKGYIKISHNRMTLWRRKEDRTGLYGSYIDTGAYTTVSGEATTSGGGTLAFKGGGATRTCFGVTITITASGEIYTDNYNGILTGSLGGTGTINYTTGAYTLSNPGVGTATYQHETSNNAGISDFTHAATRLAGQGFVFRQDDGGGDFMNLFELGDTMYCIHENKTWALTLTATDTNATNDIFRQRVGIPYLRAGIDSSIGIFYIDVTDKSKPLFRKLVLNPGSSDVIPKTVSLSINLEGYNFDQCAMWEWNDYIVFSGKAGGSTVNNRIFIYHKTWGSIDIRDYFPSCFTTANGTLLSGESISNNFVTLFSGFDDSDSLIQNNWDGNISNLRMPGWLKKERGLLLEGEIQASQILDAYIEADRGGYTFIGTIEGTGDYVDTSNPIIVGKNTVGSEVVGGGVDSEDVEAFHYQHVLPVRIDKFENRKVRFIARGIGYVSVSQYCDKDIRRKQQKIPQKYR
jgi:hypothetical protein